MKCLYFEMGGTQHLDYVEWETKIEMLTILTALDLAFQLPSIVCSVEEAEKTQDPNCEQLQKRRLFLLRALQSMF